MQFSLKGRKGGLALSVKWDGTFRRLGSIVCCSRYQCRLPYCALTSSDAFHRLHLKNLKGISQPLFLRKIEVLTKGCFGSSRSKESVLKVGGSVISPNIHRGRSEATNKHGGTGLKKSPNGFHGTFYYAC